MRVEVDNVSKLSLLDELYEDSRHVVHTIFRARTVLTYQLVQQILKDLS
jgi:hypothetical protein